MTGLAESTLVLIVPLALLGLGYLVGHWRERVHLRSLDQREQALAGMLTCNLRRITDPSSVADARLVQGEAVIATDYFKTFIAQLRSIIGGRIGVYESLMDRARREARCRMLEEAERIGATEVWNVRQETSNIVSAQRRNAAIAVEVFTFGTAIRRDRPTEAG